MRQCLCICKQVIRRSGCRSSINTNSPVNLGRKIFKKRGGKRTMEGRAKDSRSCVWRDPAWHGRGGWTEVVGEPGGSPCPSRDRAGTVARQRARADAHHSLAGRRGGRAREAGSGVRALVMTSRAGEFVGIGAQLCRACYSFSLGCLLLPRWSWVRPLRAKRNPTQPPNRTERKMRRISRSHVNPRRLRRG